VDKEREVATMSLTKHSTTTTNTRMLTHPSAAIAGNRAAALLPALVLL
jgi:hypothetical protein